jgi:phenylacetic acid degradation protein
MIYEFNKIKPVIDPSAFIHEQATIIGCVVIGANVYVGAGAVIRGDWGKIIIEDNCNIQENCVIHMFPGTTVLLKEKAHIGHGAIIHGATIGSNCLIGMQAVIMDNVVVEEECIVGALSFIPQDTIVPKRSVVVGNPAKIVKAVSDEMIAWKTKGTELYMELPKQCHDSLKECVPLKVLPNEYNAPSGNYTTWKS